MEKEVAEHINEININYACRALLGGGKGISVMEAIRAQNPEYYEHIIAEAKARLEKEGRNVELSSL
jgi:hypothetical protein